MTNNSDMEEDEDTLDDYEAGFLDGVFAVQGIENPTEEQLAAAFRLMDAFIDSHQSDVRPS